MNWSTLLSKGEIIIDEDHYNLRHLREHTFPIVIPQTQNFKEIQTNITVIFSSHCVSEGLKTQPFDFSSIGEKYKIIDNRGVERKFSTERYNYSIHLRTIIEQIIEMKCYRASDRSYFIVEFKNDTFLKNNYHIYFSTKRHEDSIRIYVESAYPKEDIQLSTYRSIRGKVLLAKTFRCQKIRL